MKLGKKEGLEESKDAQMEAWKTGNNLRKKDAQTEA